VSLASENPPGRPLDDTERAAATYLLSVDFPGREELRRQADTARVVDRCPCGCPTIYLWIDRAGTAPALEAREAIPVEARSKGESPEDLFELLLFVEDGWLKSLEIVYFSATPPSAFPPPDSFHPPLVRS